jgi:hypothetical protein
MTTVLHFACESIDDSGWRRSAVQSVAPRQLVIAGWTGRDAEAIRHHIAELAALGVPGPSAIPLYYRVGANQLTQAGEIEALGVESSGEVEPVLFFSGGDWWLTVGSDHTDRKVEAYSIAVSKQMCAKPVASAAWRWSDVAPYQDELQLRSRILEDGRWVDYQRGTLASIRPLASLLEGSPLRGAPADGSVISCGTLTAIPDARGTGIRPAELMELELRDPRRQRSIVHRYRVTTLPVVA